MAQEPTIAIKYVGKKPEKHDTVNHTGIIWRPGETKFYPTRISGSLLVHTGIWTLGKKEDVKDSPEMAEVVAASVAPQHPEIEGTAQNPEDMQTMGEMTKDRSSSRQGARATLD